MASSITLRFFKLRYIISHFFLPAYMESIILFCNSYYSIVATTQMTLSLYNELLLTPLFPLYSLLALLGIDLPSILSSSLGCLALPLTYIAGSCITG